MSGFLYHVTLAPRLDSIAENGLVPNQESAIGGVPDSHKRGRVFLCEGEGLRYWASKSEEWVEHSYDDYAEEGLAPVILRVNPANLDRSRMDVDELGSEDSRAAAFALRDNIPPESIEMWDGHAWGAVDSTRIDPRASFDDEGYFLRESPLTEVPLNEGPQITLPACPEPTAFAVGPGLDRAW